MNTRLSSLLIASSCLVMINGAVFAETQIEPEMGPAPEEAAPQIETPEMALVGQVRQLRDILNRNSKAVLAEDGDRSTAETRQDLSIWFANTAKDIYKGVPALESAHTRLNRAEMRQAEALVSLKASLDDALADAGSEWDGMMEMKMDPAVRSMMRDVIQRVSYLKTMAAELEAARDVLVELEFEEPISAEAQLVVIEQLLAFEADHKVTLLADSDEEGASLTLTGQVPESLSAADLRALLTTIWTPTAEDAEDEEAAEEAVMVSAPNFIAITLD